MKKLPSIMRFKKIFALSLSALAFWQTAVFAAQSDEQGRAALVAETLQYVTEALENQGMMGLNVEVQQLDTRIDIPRCPSPLALSATAESLMQSNITVRAKCGDTGWYLYLMVKATEMQSVVVFKDTISPGTLLTADNVAVVQIDKKTLRSSTYSSIDQVLGARSKRRSRSGQPIIPNQLCFVCKGDSIVIKANVSGLEIKTSGIAQQDGNLGDTIAVQNASSKKMIYARVSNPRQVNVGI